MHIVCCIKQVPDTTQVKIDPETNTLIRAGVESICNPYDVVAVEAAIQLAEKYQGRVTVITMGPPQADAALRECLAMGASGAVLLSDRAFAGADTLATSFTLTRAIARLAAAESVDLIFFGKQAVDGDTAQTGPGVATRLNYTQLTYVSQVLGIDSEKRTITVRREVDGGSEVIEAPLPAVLTAELTLASPRYATLPELVRSVRQEIPVWGVKELGGNPEGYGLKGSPTSVRQIFSPQARSGGKVIDAADAGNAARDFWETFLTAHPGLISPHGVTE